MPFIRPGLDALRTRIAADLTNKLEGADARLRVSNLRAFSEVEAGATHLLYGRLDWSFRQLFPDTAESEFLDRWASIWGVRRYPAAPAIGYAVWEAQPGASVPDNAIVRRSDGEQYTVPQGASEQDGEVRVELHAMEPGVAGNTDPGVTVSLMTTFAGVAVNGEVAEPGLAGGADQQSDALLLRAVLARIQAPPHGGAHFDYVRWALEVPGVTRAWCYPLQAGAGTVVVRFMMDEVRASAGGIPEHADVETVYWHIQEVRPVTANVIVYAPIPAVTDVVIEDLVPDTPAIRVLIRDNLLQMLLNEGEPGGSVFLSQWSGAIAFTPGVRRFRLLEPATQTDPQPGEIVQLGTVNYQ